MAHRLARRLHQVRTEGILSYLRPDGKTQVTIEYDGDRPVRIDTIVISSQHAEDVSLAQIEKEIKEHVIQPIVPQEMLTHRRGFLLIQLDDLSSEARWVTRG